MDASLFYSQILNACTHDAHEVLRTLLNDPNNSVYDINAALDRDTLGPDYSSSISRCRTPKISTNQNRNTALHFAAYCRSPKCVRILIDAGADCTLVNDQGFTAFDYAATKHNDYDDDNGATCDAFGGGATTKSAAR